MDEDMDRLQRWFMLAQQNEGDSDDERGGDDNGLTAADYAAFALSLLTRQPARETRSRTLRQEREDMDVWRRRIAENDIVAEISTTCSMQSPYKDPPTGPTRPLGVVGSGIAERPRGALRALTARELGYSKGSADRLPICSGIVPRRYAGRMDEFARTVFCGTFSPTGSMYMGACQDGTIRLYDSVDDFRLIKEIHADDVGWSIIDTDYSPNQQFVIYSTWSNYVHLWTASAYSGAGLHLELDFEPPDPQFCLFSIKFSQDSAEILGGASDNHIYIYDVARRQRIVRAQGHRHDVNAVAFADSSSNIILSGSDDRLCMVWDRRVLGDGMPPVGGFAGHTEGITYIDPKGDGRYFITNGKDHTIRLWDLRRMVNPRTLNAAVGHLPGYMRDYRYGPIRPRQRGTGQDHAVMAYRGHSVYRTLIRAKWSPAATTGQRYIYAGSGDGCVRVWDVLTGEIVSTMRAGTSDDTILRDVAWHPDRPVLLAAAWNASIEMFTV